VGFLAARPAGVFVGTAAGWTGKSAWRTLTLYTPDRPKLIDTAVQTRH
jgi:hypothetical protein